MFTLGLILAVLAGACSTPSAVQGQGFAILKVNRTYLDADGYDTDAIGDLQSEAVYQYHLRHTPDQQMGMRFKIKWKAPRDTSDIKLQLEVRGLNDKNETVFDTESLSFSRTTDWAEWSILDIANGRWKRLGRVTAWKVTLFAGGKMMAQMPSVNWYEDIKEQSTGSPQAELPK